MSGSSASRRSRTDRMRVAACSCCQGASDGGGAGMGDLLMVELRRRSGEVYLVHHFLVHIDDPAGKGETASVSKVAKG
jgi:hypothetical protein